MSVSSIPQTSFKTKRILVIDDEKRLAESLATLLKAVGYRVQHATTGAAGLQKVSEEEFDLVITDLRMEGVDGFDIIQYMGEHRPQTALIIITAHASTESAIEAIHKRVADYIPKPFDFEVLRNAIERVFTQQENEQLRRDLVHMLTHDIKVPLTSVLGFAQLIVDREGEISEKTPHYTEMILMNSQRILAMLDNYLTNARVEEGRLELLRVHFPLQDTIEESLNIMAPEFRKKNISVETDLQPAPKEFTGDEPLLCRAVGNLLSNAAKYTIGGGDVLIKTEFTSGRASISVTNSGEICDDDRVVVFDRYRRTGSSRGISGTGLGLHVVKCVAEAHGGTVACESVGGRVTFRIEFPME